mgnify:CR=1 FL=1
MVRELWHTQKLFLRKTSLIWARRRIWSGFVADSRAIFSSRSGKALEVTPSSLRKINHLKAKRSEREARELTAAEQLAGKINKLVLDFSLETGETGKAFGSVTAKDIHDRLAAELTTSSCPSMRWRSTRPFKESGDHEMEVRLHRDVTAKLRVRISTPKRAPAEAEPEPIKKSNRRRSAPKNSS